MRIKYKHFWLIRVDSTGLRTAKKSRNTNSLIYQLMSCSERPSDEIAKTVKERDTTAIKDLNIQ